MKDCLFCKIVAGEIPSIKIWEDNNYFAFLDINPINIGHTLLIPKNHIDYIFDLDDVEYNGIFSKAKKLSGPIKKATGATRIGIAVEGFAVPHTHIHLVPLYKGNQLDPNLQKPADTGKLIKMGRKIINNLALR